MGPVRLDVELWTPSALGVVGPGLLRSLALGAETMYRPLLAVHRDRPGVKLDDGAGTVDLVDGDADWDALVADRAAGPLVSGPFGWLRGHPATVVVAVRPGGPGRGVGALLAARIDALEPSVAEVVLLWTAGPPGPVQDPELSSRAWLRLFQGCAFRGVQGLTVAIGHRGARDVAMLRDVAGFRPMGEVYAEVGLAPSEAGVVLDEWRVTVADDEVTDIGLLAAEDEASQKEMLRRIVPLVARRGPDPATVEGPYRLSFGGPVTLDGCRSHGGLDEGDWWEPEADLQPDAARARADWVLARWAARQLAT